MEAPLLAQHPPQALDALDALAPLSPEYGVGFTDHAAMAVEALARLDPSAIGPFRDRYFPRLRPLADEPDATLRPFAPAVAREREALTRAGWASVLAERTVHSLAPGVAGAAFHGLLRVAHAARALHRGHHPVLLDELARGLAYASLRAEALPPPHDATGGGDLSLDEALAALPPSPDALTHVPGMITATLLRRAHAHPTLPTVSGRLRLDDDPQRAAAALRSAAVGLLVAGEQHPESLFTLLHGVTAMDAVCALTPLLPPGPAEALVRAAANALLALRVSYVGSVRASGFATREPFPRLRARAIRSLDDHAIKLAAALDEAERASPDPRHAAALARWVERIGA